MKKIAVITATRAEYGLLEPLICELRKHEGADFFVELIVTGTHLSARYGMTIQEIEESGIRIDHKIEIPVDSEMEKDISSNQAETLVKFTDLFLHEQYRAVIILGDRYEMFAIAIAAGNTRTPIFHLCGGDTTEGAMDEWIRHSITKMSYLHFTTNEISRKRVIQLGEAPDRVFNYGSLSIDNVLKKASLSKEEALASIGLSICRYALCTYHPVTMENSGIEKQMNRLFEAIQAFPDITFIATKSNADQGGAEINAMWDDAVTHIANLHVFTSLGMRRYLSLMKHAEFVMGNSSSGIYDAPALHVPTVNIGDRQRGRLQTESIINCMPTTSAIIDAIHVALSKEHREVCKRIINPYGSGNAAEQIAGKVYETVMAGKIDLKKQFYDLEFDIPGEQE